MPTSMTVRSNVSQESKEEKRKSILYVYASCNENPKTTYLSMNALEHDDPVSPTFLNRAEAMEKQKATDTQTGYLTVADDLFPWPVSLNYSCFARDPTKFYSDYVIKYTGNVETVKSLSKPYVLMEKDERFHQALQLKGIPHCFVESYTEKEEPDVFKTKIFFFDGEKHIEFYFKEEESESVSRLAHNAQKIVATHGDSKFFLGVRERIDTVTGRLGQDEKFPSKHPKEKRNLIDNSEKFYAVPGNSGCSCNDLIKHGWRLCDIFYDITSNFNEKTTKKGAKTGGTEAKDRKIPKQTIDMLSYAPSSSPSGPRSHNFFVAFDEQTEKDLIDEARLSYLLMKRNNFNPIDVLKNEQPFLEKALKLRLEIKEKAQKELPGYPVIEAPHFNDQDEGLKRLIDDIKKSSSKK